MKIFTLQSPPSISRNHTVRTTVAEKDWGEVIFRQV